ncbi:MAG: 4Fe-4S binding protein [Candidatus Brocadiia bacterium]
MCPHRVFTVEGQANISDRDACMECGACARDCPVDAIEVDSEVRGVFSGSKGVRALCKGGNLAL